MNFKSNYKNKIAALLNLFAIIELVSGLLIGFVLSSYSLQVSYSGYNKGVWHLFENFGVFINWAVISVTAWLAIKAFAEIIQILHDIRSIEIENRQYMLEEIANMEIIELLNKIHNNQLENK